MPVGACLFVLAVCTAVSVLYSRGFVVTKHIRAILFVFRPGKHADKATLNSCTGWVSHAVRFRESRVYDFAFEGQLSNGDAEVVLLDRQKQPLLKLNRQSPAGSIALDGNSRYYLRWGFRGATGTCKLVW